MKLRPSVTKGLLFGIPISLALYAVYSLLLYAIVHLTAWWTS